ncbi:putative DNA-binding protein (MmcQ/YjbR family) [Acholeplasma morum]|uniref:MmcQ/YjbR family DNA-binding protein n=1 Tax=Paracholeplasma morum TaxID=264637 RepID=UPI0019565919|nr:MmcQ/YjbR family DNA-binding protein [Paracholeplasma morum]MBM7454137.1 putative DNA-binding protein (MmcQ/YjbR family) [Paracholeplasma morum]
MDETALMSSLIEYGNALRGAEVYYREDWECFYFSLLGKNFGLLTNELFTLKNTPTKNTELRETYSYIIPGYHMNKNHWISIKLMENQLTLDELKELIYESYLLVYKGLSKDEKAIIDEMPDRR